MGRYRSVPQRSNRVRHKMILSLVLSVLFASMALGAPGASNYGGAAVVGPAKQIASPSIQCRTEYVTLWDTEYQEKEEQICETVYEKQCSTRTQRLCQPTTRQECHTEYEQQCSTIYKNVCVQKFRTEYEPYTESECTTEYKQDCQYEWRGEGNDKGWAPIEGTCQNVPYDQCREVAKTHARQVAYQECNDVPEQKCSLVPKQVCQLVPDEICTSELLTECEDVPEQVCHTQHKKFPVRISRKEAKKVCNVPGEESTLAPAPAPALTPVLPSSPSLVPTFTAPAPVPNSPALNQQPDLTSRPLDQQPQPQPQQQGGLSTLDEILAARKAKTSK